MIMTASFTAMIVVVQMFLVAMCAAQKDPPDDADKRGIVHLFEWKFSDIATECERFLGQMGYAAVQTSPITDHLSLPARGHPWWERYQPMSYEIISRSGNEREFAEMVKRCNNVGVRVYVDVVFNHMTGQVENAQSIGGKTADGVKRSYPRVPYEDKHFNPRCDIQTYEAPTQVRNCLLSGLNDLNQTSDYVREKIIHYLNTLIDLGVAGFRVDAAKHMWPEDLQYIYSHIKNLSQEHGFVEGKRPFIYQEVIDLGGEGVSKYEYNSFGRVTEFKYGAEIGNAFRGNNALKYLVNFGPEWGLLDSGDALAFVDNHDNQRGHGAGGASILTYKTSRLYKMAVAFMLAYPYGYPRVMSSYYFNDTDAGPPSNADSSIKDVTVNGDGECEGGWVCEHRWHPIAQMVKFTNVVKGTTVNNWWDNDNNQIAFSRGERGFVAINGESESDLNANLQTGMLEGTYCDVISGRKDGERCTGKSIVVGSDGKAAVELTLLEEGVLCIHLESKL